MLVTNAETGTNICEVGPGLYRLQATVIPQSDGQPRSMRHPYSARSPASP